MIKNAPISFRLDLEMALTGQDDLLTESAMSLATQELVEHIAANLGRTDSPAFGDFALDEKNLREAIASYTEEQQHGQEELATFITAAKVTRITAPWNGDPQTAREDLNKERLPRFADERSRALHALLTVALQYVVIGNPARASLVAHQVTKSALDYYQRPRGVTEDIALLSENERDEELTTLLLPIVSEAVGKINMVTWNLAYRCAKDARLFLTSS